MIKKITVLPDGGIEADTVAEAVKALDCSGRNVIGALAFDSGLIGGPADAIHGVSFSQETVNRPARHWMPPWRADSTRHTAREYFLSGRCSVFKR